MIKETVYMTDSLQEVLRKLNDNFIGVSEEHAYLIKFSYNSSEPNTQEYWEIVTMLSYGISYEDACHNITYQTKYATATKFENLTIKPY